MDLTSEVFSCSLPFTRTQKGIMTNFCNQRDLFYKLSPLESLESNSEYSKFQNNKLCAVLRKEFSEKVTLEQHLIKIPGKVSQEPSFKTAIFKFCLLLLINYVILDKLFYLTEC